MSPTQLLKIVSLLSVAVNGNTNPNLDVCILSVYQDGNLQNTEWGPFMCGDYSSDGGDFDDDEISSAEFFSVDDFTCYAYFFEDQFSDNVLLMEATSDNNYSQIYNSFATYGEDDTLSSISIRYESDLCQVSFYSNDHQSDQSGDILGIGGQYTKWMLESRGITNDDITSIKVEGDASCIVNMYSDESCNDDKCTVMGTGDYDLAELEDNGFVDNAMSCVEITAVSGLKSLTYLTDEKIISDPTLIFAKTDTYSNNGPGELSHTFDFETEETSSFSFSSTQSFETTISEEVEVEIPAVTSTTTISFTADFTWESTNSGSTTTKYTDSTTYTLPPYSAVECSLTLDESTLTVPYIAIYQGVDEFYQYYTNAVNGTFTTTSYYQTNVECNEIPLATDSDVEVDTTRGDDSAAQMLKIHGLVAISLLLLALNYVVN